jgi:hypothetical protein
MAGHHLIMGELKDILTHATLPDTHDERLRQGIAAMLVDRKGFSREEITPRQPLTLRAGEKCALIKIDFVVFIDDRVCMLIKYGPGSLVTRHRPALAASRILFGYQIPVVVVTNGIDADILDGASGKVIARGLETIPDRAALEKQAAGLSFAPIQPERAEKESRIAFAFEVDGSCPCDDTVCNISG